MTKPIKERIPTNIHLALLTEANILKDYPTADAVAIVSDKCISEADLHIIAQCSWNEYIAHDALTLGETTGVYKDFNYGIRNENLLLKHITILKIPNFGTYIPGGIYRGHRGKNAVIELDINDMSVLVMLPLTELDQIIDINGIKVGGTIHANFIWIRQRGQLILTTRSSPSFFVAQQLRLYDHEPKLTKSKLQPGHMYRNMKGEQRIYLGKVNYVHAFRTNLKILDKVKPFEPESWAAFVKEHWPIVFKNEAMFLDTNDCWHESPDPIDLARFEDPKALEYLTFVGRPTAVVDEGLVLTLRPNLILDKIRALALQELAKYLKKIELEIRPHFYQLVYWTEHLRAASVILSPKTPEIPYEVASMIESLAKRQKKEQEQNGKTILSARDVERC